MPGMKPDGEASTSGALGMLHLVYWRMQAI